MGNGQVMDSTVLQTTREFWDNNPCGVHADYELTKSQHYAMERYLPNILQAIGAAHHSILEVGCGQGVDSTLVCEAMAPGGQYIGIDYSPRSVETARQMAGVVAERLRVSPDYRVGNAEALDFESEKFEAVYSIGVIHHTADDLAAIKEIYRVLSPGGTAYVFLYRKPSLKVGAAQLLRVLQKGCDAVLGSDRCLYRFISKYGTSSRYFGTMFHECFGVPYMKWYNRREVLQLFSGFSTVDAQSLGANFGRLSPGNGGPSPFGYLWFIRAVKSNI